MEQLKKKKMTKKKWKSIRLFLYVAPFIALVLIFSYYPLYGWIYAFYDYRPPKPFSEAQFVGLKWFKSLVENDIKIKQIVQVLKNTFAMSALTLGTSWLPMLFAVFLNEDDRNYVEPDISVICDSSKVDNRGYQGAPDFIIEIVSPSSQRMDYLTKLFKYRTAGVREYWIVNPLQRTVQVYSFEGTEDSSQYSFDDEITVTIYGDLKICVADLLK